jgi:GTP-binding protein Era
MEEGKSFKCGLVALVGLPNAGKSTLLNAMLKEKIVITSYKPQTTRNAIYGIKTTDDYQIIFVDTPGYHAGKGRLNKMMVQQAEEAILSVDLICVLADPQEKGGPAFKGLLEKVEASGVPVILVITKLDDRSREDLYRAAQHLATLYPFKHVIPLSAKIDKNIDKLEELIAAELPIAPAAFAGDQITNQPEAFLISEFVREQVFMLLQQEVPYDTLVETERITETKDKMEIDASIIVNRDSQKGIVIGKGAEMLKEIGTRARKDLERFFGIKIRLNLHVKVRTDWADKDEYLKIQGLQ